MNKREFNKWNKKFNFLIDAASDFGLDRGDYFMETLWFCLECTPEGQAFLEAQSIYEDYSEGWDVFPETADTNFNGADSSDEKEN